ncbi:hypothetical protein ACFW04_000187 [Cataglyphis niger]
MKGIYLIAIAFLASRTAASVIIPNEAEDECPIKDSCPPKLIADKSNCHQFFRCKSGKKELVVCKGDKQFSTFWGGCVSPENSDCGVGDCKHNGDLLPHECQCDQFYECKNYQKALRICESGQIFDKNRKICVPGESVNGECVPNSGIECRNGDYIRHECQCDKYYECKQNQKALRECPKGSIFEPPSGCVKGNVDECSSENTCRQGESKSHHCLCEKYYICNNNDWIAKSCKKDEHFSPKNLTCMKIKDANCENFPVTPDPTEPGYCAENGSISSHECDCRLYYECENNKKILKNCDWGKYFDRANKVCEKAEDVKCRNSWDNWIKKYP